MMIKYYLDEEPILHNAPTYLPFYEDDMKYVLDNLEKLVIKDVAEAGGYGVVFGNDLTKEKLEEFRRTRIAEPRRFIAQEVIDFLDLPILDNGETVMRIDIYYRFIGKVGNENGEALKTQKMRWNTKALAPSA